MKMQYRCVLMAVLMLPMVFSALPAHAQSVDDRYSIMRPEKSEPWLAPKYKSPRGTRQHVRIPPPAALPQRSVQVPPPLYVPQTGRTLPNLPTVGGSGPGGRETFQDRAARCAHQAGVYGPNATGNPSAYINSCINQY
jgi:hypothetical protein